MLSVSRRGFTLVEVLVVLLLIATVVSIAASAWLSVRSRAEDEAFETAIAGVVREVQVLALARGDGTILWADVEKAVADAPRAAEAIVLDPDDAAVVPELTLSPDPAPSDTDDISVPAFGTVTASRSLDRTAVGMLLQTRRGALVAAVVATDGTARVWLADHATLSGQPSYRPTGSWAMLEAGLVETYGETAPYVSGLDESSQSAGTPQGTVSASPSASQQQVVLCDAGGDPGNCDQTGVDALEWLARWGATVDVRHDPFAADLVNGAARYPQAGESVASLVFGASGGITLQVPADGAGPGDPAHVTFDLGPGGTLQLTAASVVSSNAGTVDWHGSADGGTWTALTLPAADGFRFVRAVFAGATDGATVDQVEMFGVLTLPSPVDLGPSDAVTATLDGNDNVQVTFDTVTGATRYVVRRDGQLLDTVDVAAGDTGTDPATRTVMDFTAGDTHTYTVVAQQLQGGAVVRDGQVATVYLSPQDIAGGTSWLGETLRRSLPEGAGVRAWTSVDGQVTAAGDGTARRTSDPDLGAVVLFNGGGPLVADLPDDQLDATTVLTVVQWDGTHVGAVGFSRGLHLELRPAGAGLGSRAVVVAPDGTQVSEAAVAAGTHVLALKHFDDAGTLRTELHVNDTVVSATTTVAVTDGRLTVGAAGGVRGRLTVAHVSVLSGAGVNAGAEVDNLQTAYGTGA